MTRNRQHMTIASDDRARIPFAVVGVLLLLSSAVLIGVLQSRPEPDRDIDPSLALDRSTAATQSAIKSAVLDAADTAGASPVTEPATEGPFAELLGDDGTSSTDVFRNYTALLVYRTVHARVDGTTHAIRNETTATVSLAGIDDRDDAVEAMDRVSFEAGYETGDRQRGTVRVTIEDIEFEIRQDGDHIATRTRDVSVVVATPVFQVHERVSVYQDRTNMSMLEGSGFEGIGREFAARTYPIVIAKSMFNYARGTPTEAPIQEVVPKKQTSTLMNHANYAVQSKTFKTRDPLWDRPMKSNMVCWLAWEVDQNYERVADGDDDNSSDDSSGVLPKPNASMFPESNGTAENYEYFCRGAEFLFGDDTGTPGEVPSLWDIITGELNDQDAMQKEEELRYDVFVKLTDADIRAGISDPDLSGSNLTDDAENSVGLDEDPNVKNFAEGDLDDAVESVYSMDLAVETEGEDTEFNIDVERPSSIDDPSNWTHEHDADTDAWGEHIDAEIAVDEMWTERSDPGNTDPKMFEVQIEEKVRYKEAHRWVNDTSGAVKERTFSDTGTITIDVTIWGESASGAKVTLEGEDYFDAHSGTVQNLFEGATGVSDDRIANFDNAPESAFLRAFDVSSVSTAEADIEALFEADPPLDKSAALETIGNPAGADGATLGPADVTSGDPMAFARVTADRTRERIQDENPRRYARSEFLTGNPFRDMERHLLDLHEPIVYNDTDDPFLGMGSYLRAEVRHRYHHAVADYTRMAADEYDKQKNSGLKDKIDGDNALDEGMELAQDAVNREPPSYDGTMETADLLGEVSFEVRGSPTYLEFEYVNRSTVPAVRPAGNAASNLTGAEDTEHVPASACTNNRIGYFGLPLLPWPSSWIVTASSWGVTIKGEYARFEVTANVSEPSRVTSLSYIREDKDVTMTIGGEDGTVGAVEPIYIDTYAEFPMVVPAGKGGTGDPAGGGPTPTTEWKYVGPGYDPDNASDDSC